MPSDSMFVRDNDNNMAIRVVSNTGVSAEPDSVFTRDEDGNVAMRVTSSGGGGGSDPHNLGWYATQSALEEAHPTAEAGDWAIVGATDTVWIWDTDNSEWVDSDQKGQVTSVNGQTGDVVLDLLPSQTGQSGKFLTTDGTDASWSDKPLVNTNPTASTTVIIGNNNGSVSSVGNNAICLTHMGSYGGWIALGSNAIAIGSTKNSIGSYSINIGGSSCAGNYAIQLGGNGTNSDANTFKVGNANGNFEMMSADGTIPTARLTKVNTTITLTAAGWSSNTQTVNVTGMTAAGVVFPSPDPVDQSAYTSAGILCTAQAAGTLTFTCDTVPSADIDVNVVML